jgi:hypothetical protein
MLTADLLRMWKKGPYVGPKYIKLNQEEYIKLATDLINLIVHHKGKTRGEIQEALQLHLADSPDYLIHRGFSKLLLDMCEFHVVIAGGMEPMALRKKLFQLAAENRPVVIDPDIIHPVTRDDLLLQVSLELQVPSEMILSDMYADLPENHVLATFEPPAPTWLIHRYNLALAQAILYNCIRMRLIAYRNIPARYKQLFKFIKFYQLMHSVTGDLDSGYEILLDGPASLFRLSKKYGIRMATFLPALLLCTKWKMEAEIVFPDQEKRYFVLDSETHKLESHYKDAAQYDSLLEERFAERFEKLDSDWILERETEIVNLKDTVFIPDFAFRHVHDGRIGLLEIVGFWRSDYIERKLTKLKRAGLQNLVIAVSQDLNVSESDFKEIPGSLFFFKTVIDPKEVLRRLEQVARKT